MGGRGARFRVRWSANMSERIFDRRAVGLVAVLSLALVRMDAAAQQPPPQAAPPATARATAPFDPTGYWVSIVTEDWRWRMVTPSKGDVTSVPVNAQGQQAANAWDYATDIAAGNQCKAYGAG